MSAILAVLGVGSVWRGFQPGPLDAHGKLAFVAEILASVTLKGTMPLLILLGLFLLVEAYRMAFSKGRYRRHD